MAGKQGGQVALEGSQVDQVEAEPRNTLGKRPAPVNSHAWAYCAHRGQLSPAIRGPQATTYQTP